MWQREAACPCLPCTLSLQPEERESVKRRQFPWNIRIKSTWKDEKGLKEIKQMWIRNTGERGREAIKGRRSAGCFLRAAGVPCESGTSTQLGEPGRQISSLWAELCVALHAQVLCCLKPISQHLKDSWSLFFPSCLRVQTEKTFSPFSIMYNWYWSYVSAHDRHLTSVS